MRFLITGHTGFKGSWLIALLRHRGHEVHGVSLSNLPESLFAMADMRHHLESDISADIRNLESLLRIFQKVAPDVVVHFAAQSLVPNSFLDPLNTYSTNVVGTINVLECIRQTNGIKASLIVTTDKVYRNKGVNHHYVEEDELGGLDPYSASKAMADIASQSWVNNFIETPVGIVRAGNVIGGGDIAPNRLIPDLVRGYTLGVKPKLRSLTSIRPWQNVLDCLQGYLLLIENLIDKKQSGIWNFGPDHSQIKTVKDVVTIFEKDWGLTRYWELNTEAGIHEEQTLLVDSSKARTILGWNDRYSFSENIGRTSKWYKAVSNGKSTNLALQEEIEYFESRSS
jgi:CDP-glucose 4,6-dehydratase